MSLKIGDIAPDFQGDTTEGRIRFHDWLGDSWAVLFAHPQNFAAVCTAEFGNMQAIESEFGNMQAIESEFGNMQAIESEFERRGVKIIGVSPDPIGNREDRGHDIDEAQSTAVRYPIIADTDFNVRKLYEMLPVGDVVADRAGRTQVDDQTVRNLFVIAPNKRVNLILACPMADGRIFDVVLRVIDSLGLTVKDTVVTPA